MAADLVERGVRRHRAERIRIDRGLHNTYCIYLSPTFDFQNELISIDIFIP